MANFVSIINMGTPCDMHWSYLLRCGISQHFTFLATLHMKPL